jgi:hypothetical protein
LSNDVSQQTVSADGIPAIVRWTDYIGGIRKYWTSFKDSSSILPEAEPKGGGSAI